MSRENRKPVDGRKVEQCHEPLETLMYALSPNSTNISFQQEVGKWYCEIWSCLVLTVITALQKDVFDVFLESPTLKTSQEFFKQGSFSNNNEKASSLDCSFRPTIVPKLSLLNSSTTISRKHCTIELSRPLWCPKTSIEKHHIKEARDRHELVGKPNGQGENKYVRVSKLNLHLNKRNGYEDIVIHAASRVFSLTLVLFDATERAKVMFLTKRGTCFLILA